MIDKDRPAAGPASRLYVLRAIAHHEALRQVQVIFSGNLEQHAGIRLSPRTGIVAVIAGVDLTYLRQLLQHMTIDSFHEISGNRSPAHVGLVAGADEHKTGGRQLPHRPGHPRKNLHLLQGERRIRPAVPHHAGNQHAVPIQKHGLGEIGNPKFRATDGTRIKH